LQAQPIKVAVDWMEQFRKEWDDRLDRLDSYLQELQENKTGKKKP
jgi:alkanesulfonate monooxygenase SsuD/methylene tetrahydromethanopterin reductase-like flavin-dependent oxidoreductase (luciferase family)